MYTFGAPEGPSRELLANCFASRSKLVQAYYGLQNSWPRARAKALPAVHELVRDFFESLAIIPR